MSAKLEILLAARELNPGVIKSVTAEVRGVGSAAQDADSKLKSAGAGASSFAEKIDAAGRNARSGLGAIAQLSNAARTGLGALSSQAAGVADAVGDMVGSFLTMGPIGVAVAAVGVAIGGVITLLHQQEAAAAAALEKQRQYEEGLRQTYENARAALNELAPKEDPMKGLADSIPLAIEKLRELAATSEEARDKLNRLLTSQEGARVLEDRIATLSVKIRELKAEIAASISDGAPEMDRAGANAELEKAESLLRVYTEALQGAKDAQAKLVAELSGTSAELTAQNAALEANTTRWEALNAVLANYASKTDAAAMVTNRWDQYNRAIAASVGMTESQMEKSGQSLDEYNAKWKKLAEDGTAKAKAAIDKLKSALTGLAREALTPTTVTDADMAATALGKYVDKWDELARQADDVAITPENIAKYGELAKALDQTGMSASQFAASFRNMSLFADPKNLNLVNWEAVTAQIKDKIRGMIGEANLMKEAFRQAVASLSPSELRAFAQALDVDPGDAANVDKLFAAYTGKEADETKATLGDMAGKIKIIEGEKTTVLNFIWDKARSAIDEANAYLEEKILQYGDILVEITAKFNPPTPPAGTTTDTGGTGGGPDGKAAGGPVVGGKTYWVGEEGPELFIPHTSGTILPHTQSSSVTNSTFSSWNGGGINVHFHGGGYDEQWMRKVERELRRRWGSNAALRSAMRI